MGNPHIVFFVEDLNNEVDINEGWPISIENSIILFHKEVNVEVCQIINKSKIKALQSGKEGRVQL